MSDALKNTVGRLPDILTRNAASMMVRIVEAAQGAISADAGFGTSAYSVLLLKMGSEDLARAFHRALRTSMEAYQNAPGGAGASALGLGLSIEPLNAEGAPTDSDFDSSTARFTKLCAKADALGVEGLSAYSKDVFLAAFNDAFGKSRIDPPELEKIMPYARQALNVELEHLYAKLDAL